MSVLPGSRGKWGHVLFVDPGITATGVAFWKDLQIAGPVTAPEKTQVLRPSTGNSQEWEGKAHEICCEFAGLVRGWQVRWIVLEMPQVWNTSATSMASASTGDLLKLVYLVGEMGWLCRDICDRAPVLLNVNAWKGQMPKDTVERRIAYAFKKAKIKYKKFPNHVSDAVGMGLHAQDAL